MADSDNLNDVFEAVISGDRAALARAITLIESTRDDHIAQAQQLLDMLLPHTGKSIRIGITGVPGVGKSSFIEAFGMQVIEKGHKVAVLAVDPSSDKTGGSILGDKTRMHQLSQQERAYIRPSPTRGSLGGVARRTREAMLVCEAAGYDFIFIETVGVGQSETEVASMVDLFMLLLLPGSGDELQGIKKGIMEMADMIIVNKADGDHKSIAERVRSDYAAAVRMLQPNHDGWKIPVLTCSSLENVGLDKVWDQMTGFSEFMHSSGKLHQLRARQAKAWMWKEIREQLLSRFSNHPDVAAALSQMEQGVLQQNIPPTQAALKLINIFLKD